MGAEIEEKRRLEDAMLLALAMEEGARPEVCRQPPAAGEGKEMDYTAQLVTRSLKGNTSIYQYTYI